jgi:hypothetical protein
LARLGCTQKAAFAPADLNNRTYVVAPSSWYLPAAARYLPFLFFVFARCERENEKRKEEDVPLCRRL